MLQPCTNLYSNGIMSLESYRGRTGGEDVGQRSGIYTTTPKLKKTQGGSGHIYCIMVRISRLFREVMEDLMIIRL